MRRMRLLRGGEMYFIFYGFRIFVDMILFM